MRSKLVFGTLILALAISDVDAGLEEGRAARHRGDYATAINELRPLAEQGNAVAQWNLGIMYALGQGVDKNEIEAAMWFRKSAEQRDPNGLVLLGITYENGHGVQQSAVEAVRWYREAAEMGFANGQLHLADMYAQGIGVTQDLDEAVKWYRRASEQGSSDARRKLEDLLSIKAAEESPRVPTTAQIEMVPAEALAQSIRSVTDGQLSLTRFVKAADRDNVTFTFSELGKWVTINRKNAELWEDVFVKRLDVYSSVAKRRGATDISGSYAAELVGSACGKANEKFQASITQDGNSFQFRRSDRPETGVGTIIENAIVLNLGGLTGQVPYLEGDAANDIILRWQGVDCQLRLARQ